MGGFNEWYLGNFCVWCGIEWNWVIWFVVQELVQQWVLVGFQIGWVVLEYDFIVGDCDYLIVDWQGFVYMVVDNDVGQFQVVVEVLDQVYDYFVGDWVQFGQWFVVDYQWWIQSQCVGQCDVVCYVVGQFVWLGIGGGQQVYCVQFYLYQVVQYWCWQVGMGVQWQCDVFGYGQVGEQVIVLQQYVDVVVYFVQCVVVGGDWFVEQCDVVGYWMQFIGQCGQQGGFVVVGWVKYGGDVVMGYGY